MQDAYRPESWEGVVGQPTERIRRLIDGARTPDFLFHGPPGTGKTTTAYLVARDLQGSFDDLMECNASDERGIDDVRDTIIPAANQTTLSGGMRVIFLDEMESMTHEAQQALRQPMEQSSAVFILACNDLDAVHDALQSRCHVEAFEALDDHAVRRRIEQIADEEGVDLSRDDLSTIVGFANGDMRSAIQRYVQVVRGAIERPAGGAGDDGNAFEQQSRSFLEGD